MQRIKRVQRLKASIRAWEKQKLHTEDREEIEVLDMWIGDAKRELENIKEELKHDIDEIIEDI